MKHKDWVTRLVILAVTVAIMLATPAGKEFTADPKAWLQDFLGMNKDEEAEWSREDDIERFLWLLNYDREHKKGLTKVKLNDDLCKVAQRRAEISAKTENGGHYLPIEGTPLDTWERLGVTLTFKGECASSYDNTKRDVADAYNGLYRSKGHHDIMFASSPKYVGIGIAPDDGEHYTLYYIYIVFGS